MEKNNSFLSFLLILILLGLCGYFVWMYFSTEKSDVKKDKSKTLEDNQALKIVEESYMDAIKIYKLKNVFNLSEKAEKIDQEKYYEITDYNKVMDNVFTDNGKDEFANYYSSLLKKRDDRTYSKYYLNEQDIEFEDNYQKTTFDKVKIEKEKIVYNAEVLYKDNTKEEKEFILKLEDEKWLVDKFYFPYKLKS